MSTGNPEDDGPGNQHAPIGEYDSQSHDEPDRELAQAVIARYANAYLVARAARGVGGFVKAVASIVGILGLLPFAFLMLGDHPLVAAAVLAAVLVNALVIWVIGVLLSAVAEHLRASLDVAVYSSPFLGRADKAEMISLTN